MWASQRMPISRRSSPAEFHVRQREKEWLLPILKEKRTFKSSSNSKKWEKDKKPPATPTLDWSGWKLRRSWKMAISHTCSWSTSCHLASTKKSWTQPKTNTKAWKKPKIYANYLRSWTPLKRSKSWGKGTYQRPTERAWMEADLRRRQALQEVSVAELLVVSMICDPRRTLWRRRSRRISIWNSQTQVWKRRRCSNPRIRAWRAWKRCSLRTIARWSWGLSSRHHIWWIELKPSVAKPRKLSGTNHTTTANTECLSPTSLERTNRAYLTIR